MLQTLAKKAASQQYLFHAQQITEPSRTAIAVGPGMRKMRLDTSPWPEEHSQLQTGFEHDSLATAGGEAYL
jgi:hypothetical protein